MNHVSLVLLVLILASTSILGCASGPQLEKYPRKEMDRPFTLPKGVATWHIPTIFGYLKDNNSSTTIPPIPVPLIWETALSDDWNLLWAPLPLGISYQFYNSESSRAGLSMGTGFSYGSISGFRFQPSFTFSYRHKLTPGLAIDLEPSITPDIPFRSGQSFRWSTGLSMGPLFQLSEEFALKTSASVRVSRGKLPEKVASYRDIEIDEVTTGSVDFGVTGVWSFGRQWDLRPSYHFSGLGSKNDFQSHLGMIEFVHFW